MAGRRCHAGFGSVDKRRSTPRIIRHDLALGVDGEFLERAIDHEQRDRDVDNVAPHGGQEVCPLGALSVGVEAAAVNDQAALPRGEHADNKQAQHADGDPARGPQLDPQEQEEPAREFEGADDVRE